MDIPNALISGISGVIGGGFIRLAIDRYLQRQSEKKLAYTHLLKVNLLLAAYTSSSSQLQETLQRLELETDAASVSEDIQIVIFLRKLFKENSAIFLFEEAGAQTINSALKIFMQHLEELKIPPHELTKLPQEVCLAYTDFLLYRTSVREVIELWKKYLEDGKSEWISSEQLLYHKHLLKKFFGTAVRLQLGLANYSTISNDEAQELLRRQVFEYARVGHELELDLQKIKKIATV